MLPLVHEDRFHFRVFHPQQNTSRHTCRCSCNDRLWPLDVAKSQADFSTESL